MPADRLAFAVRVGRQDQGVGLFASSAIDLELLRLSGIASHCMAKPCVRIDRAVLRRQVADVAVGGQHTVPRAQIFLDGFRLRWRIQLQPVSQIALTHTRITWGLGILPVKRAD